MIQKISASTRVFALLGDPVSHSLSPAFQNAAIRAAELDAVYIALRCSAADLAGALASIARAGGGGNVTVPHKEIAAAAIERPTQAVLDTGACNTFWLEGGRICGDNTDIVGFKRAVEAVRGASAAGARVLLIGAGGVARAGLYSLLEQNAAEVVIMNRSVTNAAQLAERYDTRETVVRALSSPGELTDRPFDLVVNATSLGLRPGDAGPLPPDFPFAGATVIDLVYARNETAWVHEVRAAGATAADGLEMLLQQGAAAFERWWGRAAPLEAMRAALPPR